MFIHNFLLSLRITTLVLATPVPQELPTIDLGYAVYRASYYNESYDAYVFSNIRFAAPPTGTLRFAAPQPPIEDRSTIHDGTEGFVCPRAEATYLPDARSVDPASEDCLFLDVIVPRGVLNGNLGEVPILFLLFGGGYTFGSKTTLGDPINFLKDSPSPVIYVAPNYRLGIFGWLGGPSFTLSSGTVPNAGLYDQRLALQWVQQHIHLFHGNKDEVTVMGASSGSSSIIHHITAYGGKGKSLFKRAIPMGPTFWLSGGHADAEEIFSNVEAAAGCTGNGVDCLRSLSTEALQKVNRDVISPYRFPRFGPGPIVDGDLIPDAPAYLLAQGRFHKNITILVSNDIDEGSIYANSGNAATTAETLAVNFPHTTTATRDELLAFYPPPSDNTPYTTETARTTKLAIDITFYCNRYLLSAAFPDSTYNLLFSIPPGAHGTGQLFIFRNTPGSEAVLSPQIQYDMRRFVMSFTLTGNPNGADGKGVSEGVEWPIFGSEGKGLGIDGKNVTVIDAAVDKAVCEWWAKSLILT